MILAQWLELSANILKKLVESIKMLKTINCLLFFMVLTTCSQTQKRDNWSYPPDNPFPSILEIKKYDDQKVGLIAKLKPRSVKMSCRLRNDSPYYWCGLEGELMNPSPDLPGKITTVFHVILAEEGRQAVLKLVKRFNNNKAAVFAVLTNRPFKDSSDDTITSQLYGAFTDHECFDLFENFSLCPQTAKKLNIFTGNYLE